MGPGLELAKLVDFQIEFYALNTLRQPFPGPPVFTGLQVRLCGGHDMGALGSTSMHGQR